MWTPLYRVADASACTSDRSVHIRLGHGRHRHTMSRLLAWRVCVRGTRLAMSRPTGWFVAVCSMRVVPSHAVLARKLGIIRVLSSAGAPGVGPRGCRVRS